MLSRNHANHFELHTSQGYLTMRILTMRILVFVALTFALAAQTPAPKAAVPSGDAVNGRKIFDKYGCYQCHDHDAKGGAGARLAPNPIPFAVFSRYVRKPTGEMPPYTIKVVSDQELADIYAFLQTIPAPPSAKSLAILHN
jgi:mono/diheme cytochrome c family protein